MLFSVKVIYEHRLVTNDVIKPVVSVVYKFLVFSMEVQECCLGRYPRKKHCYGSP